MSSSARKRQRGRRIVLEADSLLQWSGALVFTGIATLTALYVPAGLVMCMATMLLGAGVGAAGMVLHVRQRGLLELIPERVRTVMLTSSLLEWLTDFSFFNALRPYAIFLLGLNEEETEYALNALPVEVQTTLMRPGVVHLLPDSMQRALLPQPPVSLEIDIGGALARIFGARSSEEPPRPGRAETGRRFMTPPRARARNPAATPVETAAAAAASVASARDANSGGRQALLDSLAWNDAGGTPARTRDPLVAFDSPLRVEGFLVGPGAPPIPRTPPGAGGDATQPGGGPFPPTVWTQQRQRELMNNLDETVQVYHIAARILRKKLRRMMYRGLRNFRGMAASVLLAGEDDDTVWRIDRTPAAIGSALLGGGLGAALGLRATRAARPPRSLRTIMLFASSAAGAYSLLYLRRRLVESLEVLEEPGGARQRSRSDSVDSSVSSSPSESSELQRQRWALSRRALWALKVAILMVVLGIFRLRFVRRMRIR